MSKKSKFIIGLFIALAGLVGVGWWLASADIAVLSPSGQIADQQRDLIYFGSLISLIVVLPVFVMTGWIVWKYRETNQRATYRPDWDRHLALETVWWTVPLLLITILSVVTWKSSHELDPFKPISSPTKPLEIQVVALQWKWLFIYPEQRIASVNEVRFPKNTPLNFSITSDAPMNSFWIPKLGGQMYAMSGMSTQLHLMADQTGRFEGSSANISGHGFADMKFMAHATTELDWRKWVNQVKQTPDQLDQVTYDQLAQPGVKARPHYYQAETADLYNRVVQKYLSPGKHDAHTPKQQYSPHDHTYEVES